MKIINLDDTGIKLINSKKQQLYIKVIDLPEFTANNYSIEGNMLTFKGNSLFLSDKDIIQLPEIITYIKEEILRK